MKYCGRAHTGLLFTLPHPSHFLLSSYPLGGKVSVACSNNLARQYLGNVSMGQTVWVGESWVS